jgi:beta-lactamase superfamily II metal-dependent hydrolase
MIEHGLPRGWRTRLVKNDVFGVPVWTIDGGQSVSFALRTVPSLEHYAVTYSSGATVSQTMTVEEFYAVQQQGLTIHGLVLTHVGRDHAFPLDARIEPADAAGLEERLRQLGLR